MALDRPRLVLGPMLRHVGDTSATIWVETDRPCTVRVATWPADEAGAAIAQPRAKARTWTVHGHYYALVCLDDLAPGETVAYGVSLDDTPVWPEPDSAYPPSLIRTVDHERDFTLVFGSCRLASPRSMGSPHSFGADALDSLAIRMASQPPSEWADALLLLGDQVYADHTSPVTREFIRSRRDITAPPYNQVADFEEYTQLYRESWGDPEIRWLLSTLPSSMIFDDHDVRDDWNTSHAWRLKMQATSWWETRIVGALMSYWIYQHLGNLGVEELAADELYAMVRDSGDRGVEEELARFAAAADREADGRKGAQWSYKRNFGRNRLLVIDSRCGRVLEGRREMLSEAEFDWIEEQVEGDYDHLLIGTSLPWLLPRAIHDLQSWNEAVCAGVRGPRMAVVGEQLRRAMDLEHWASFRDSFDRLARLIGRVGRGEHGPTAPATITVLSGDVHHAYVAQADYPEPMTSPVYQLTCSPVHNPVQRIMHLAFWVGWSRTAERLAHRLARRAEVDAPAVSWRKTAGPLFGNEVASLRLSGRSASVLFEKARIDERGLGTLQPAAEIALTEPAARPISGAPHQLQTTTTKAERNT